MTAEREHPRYAHDAVLTVHTGGQAYNGRTRNVSRGGICADFPDAVPLGVDIEVDIQLIFEDKTQSEALRLPARVVWCTTVNDSFQIGIAFKPLDSELSQYLTIFLRYLQDGTKVPRSKRESTLDKRFG